MVELYKHRGNWEHCLAEMNGIEKPATAREGMQERIKQGVDADISKGSRFPENVNYVRGKVLWTLAEYNPQIPYTPQVVEANRNGKYFQLTPDVKLHGKPASQLLLEIAEEDATKPVWKRRILDSKHKKTFSIPANRLGEVEEAIFLARGEKLAGDYGNFVYDALKSLGLTNPEITFYLAELRKQDFAAGFWLRSVDRGRSGFYGDRHLHDDVGCLFGVRKKSAKGTSPKISPFTAKEARQYTPEDLQAFDSAVRGLEATIKPELLEPLLQLRKKL